MPRPRVSAGGGAAAIRYTLRKGREAGGLLRLYRRLRTRNACKTCAFGMGGQRGGTVNEAGGFPEVCKKSIQAQVGDMQRPIPESFFKQHSVKELEDRSSIRLEAAGLHEGDTVTVESSCGSMRVVAAFIDIARGNLAMYYPEANVLVPRNLDPASGTPAFKSIAVRLVH